MIKISFNVYLSSEKKNDKYKKVFTRKLLSLKSSFILKAYQRTRVI